MNIGKLSARQLKTIIAGAYDDIESFRKQLTALKLRREKNQVYTRIQNRESIIKTAKQLLK